jgi:undecaprenyl-diphosphatase
MNATINNDVALWIGILQGLSEMFPVSSFGQSIVIPYLLRGIVTDRTLTLETPGYFQLILVTHLATALVLFFYYKHDWLVYMRSFKRAKAEEKRRTILFKLALASLPVLILGFLVNKPIEKLFSGSYFLVAFFLMVNGAVLFLCDFLKRGEIGKRELTKRNFTERRAFKIGVFQSIALLPGLSRLGLIMVGSRMQGYSYEISTYIAYLLSLPVILAATLFKLTELRFFSTALITGFFVSLISSYIAVSIMRRFARKSDNMTPFAIFTLAEGALTMVVYFLH